MVGHLEIGEVEARRHDTADEDWLGPSGPGSLPSSGRHQRLWSLARLDSGSDDDLDRRLARLVAGTAEQQRERAAPVPEPQLVGPDAVPA
jgi:hypothetical protein